MIGGNIIATIQVKSNAGKNAIGESTELWDKVGTVLGWLDYQSGENGVQSYDAKIQETTHVFICDFYRWNKAVVNSSLEINSENSRLILNGETYNILMIDNPMNMNQHIEVYLKYVGGGLGV